jgi:hypothetical protein
MTEKQTLEILYKELHPYIRNELSESTIYNLNDIIALACREGGSKVIRLMNKGHSLKNIFKNFTGDNGHGHSIYQIDDRSYKSWIDSGKWRDLGEATKKCLEVLEEKKTYLERKGYTLTKLGYYKFKQAIFAAYNCGQGNVSKALRKGMSPDRYTAHGNYGEDVLRLSKIVDSFTCVEQAEALDGINKRGKTIALQGDISQKEGT